MSGKAKKAAHSRALVFGEIEELRRKGFNQTEIANLHGVSRQAVSWHKTTYGGTEVDPPDRQPGMAVGDHLVPQQIGGLSAPA